MLRNTLGKEYNCVVERETRLAVWRPLPIYVTGNSSARCGGPMRREEL
jgi:hypothetical protein